MSEFGLCVSIILWAYLRPHLFCALGERVSFVASINPSLFILKFTPQDHSIRFMSVGFPRPGFIVCVVCCLAMVSCGSGTFLERDEYLAFVENKDHQLSQVKTIGELEYTALLCPLDYVVAREFRVDRVKRDSYTRKCEDLRGFYFFKLRIRNKNKTEEAILYKSRDEQTVKERLEYFSYGFEENIGLISSAAHDTIPVSLYHFERTYGVVPYLDFVFSFKADSLTGENGNKLNLVINDRVFNHQVLSFDFDKTKFMNFPKLKIY